MSIGFGPRRPVLPAPNRGVASAAQRKVGEAAGRAAERTREAVAVDGHPSRIWLRQPRGGAPCPCSNNRKVEDGPLHVQDTGLDPGSAFEVVGVDAEFDDVHAEGASASSVNPRRKTAPSWSDATPVGDDEQDVSVEDSDVMRLLLGNGRRCGLCWGTGFLDGYRLWGGERLICCAVDTLAAEIVDAGSDLDIDDDFPTPTFVGPGRATWRIEMPASLRYVDSVRVCDGLGAARPEGVQLHFSASGDEDSWFDAYAFFGELGAPIDLTERPTAFYARLTLSEDARASHVEVVARSEGLTPTQIPQIQQAAAAEIVAAFIASDFEVDPAVGYLERGTLIEVPSGAASFGTLWVVTDVMVKRTAAGQIFGITGQCRNAQPTEVVTAALLDGTAFIGSFFTGSPTRGLESTGVGGRTGVTTGTSDDTVAAIIRGPVERRAGGAIDKTFSFQTGFTRDDAEQVGEGLVDDWTYGDQIYHVEVNTEGQTQFELQTAYMTVNGVDYFSPDVVIDGTQVTWAGPFELDEDDEVTVSLTSFLAVNVTPTAGQTSFVLVTPIATALRQHARLEINGVGYYAPDVTFRTNEIVWNNKFRIAPEDTVRLIYPPAT